MAAGMAELSRSADLHSPKMLQVARMSGLVKLRCSCGHLDERQQWAETAATYSLSCGATRHCMP